MKLLFQAFMFAVVPLLLFSPAGMAQAGDAGFHSCTVYMGGGYDWVRGGDGGYIAGNGAFQVGGGFAASHHLFITGTFMFDDAHIKRNIPITLPAGANPGGKARYYTLSLDPTYRIRPDWRISPYVLGGGGWMRRTAELTSPSPYPQLFPEFLLGGGYSTHANTGTIDGGGGADIRLTKTGLKMYVEMRYVKGMAFNSHSRLVPVTIGFRW